MTNPFDDYKPGVESSAIAAYAITPSDSVDITQSIRALTVNVGGVISYISSHDGATYTTAALPAGTYAMFASRILATGTTATDLTGWV